MAVILRSGASANDLTVDPTSKAARVTLYDTNGNVITPINQAAVVPATTGGLLQMGADNEIARLIRASPDGTLRTTCGTLFLYDSVEGAAVDTNKWLSTTTTQTITQASGVITFNAGSSVATTTGCMLTSNRMVPVLPRVGYVFRTRVRITAHFSNGQVQFGFGAPTSVTNPNTVTNGAFFRKDATGQIQGVLAIGGAEILGAILAYATFLAAVPATDYAWFEVFLEETRATFTIQTQAGVLVYQSVLDFTGPTSGFTATHLQVFHHCLNTGGTGTANQMLVSGATVLAIDVDALSQRTWSSVVSGMSNGPITSPTAYTQLANYTNNTAPTARALSNTAAAETTLGGLVRANSIAGAANDLILFGFQVPSPYTFYFTGIRIGVPLNEVAAVATTDTLFQYGMAFNSSAVSLATAGTNPPMRVALGGYHIGVIGLAANKPFTGNDILWQPLTPIAVQPSKFLHVFVRETVGTATATETYQWGVVIDGYFE